MEDNPVNHCLSFLEREKSKVLILQNIQKEYHNKSIQNIDKTEETLKRIMDKYMKRIKDDCNQFFEQKQSSISDKIKDVERIISTVRAGGQIENILDKVQMKKIVPLHDFYHTREYANWQNFDTVNNFFGCLYFDYENQTQSIDLTLKTQLNVIDKFDTDHKWIKTMTISQDGIIMVHNGKRKTLEKFKLNTADGSVRDDYDDNGHDVIDMASTESGDVLFTVKNDHHIKLCTSSGEIKNKCIIRSDLRDKPSVPLGLHIISPNRMAVGTASKVVIIDSEGTILGNHSALSEKGKRLLTNPIRVALYPNGYLSVLDTKHIITFNRSGKLLWKNTDYNFCDMKLTLSGNLVTCDYGHHLICIFSPVGKYLINFNAKEHNIKWPYSLLVNNTGHIFIGCYNGVFDDNSKLYKCEITGVLQNIM